MKSLILLYFALFNWINYTIYPSATWHPSTTQDTITRLEQRVEKNLFKLQSDIDHNAYDLEILQNKMAQQNLDKKQLKNVKNQIKVLQQDLSFNYQKQNAYRHALTLIRQLKIHDEITAGKSLKEIDHSLKLLDENKLPKFKDLNPIPSRAYVRVNTNVYDQEISSLCNLNRNLDGKIIANVYAPFFEYTDPTISTHFKESDFLECQARFIKTKKDYFLELKFLMNSTKASSIYGAIDPSNPAKIEFIDGDFIYLETYALTSGVLDPETGSTIFNVQYKLNKEDIKNIHKKDINTFTVLWTSGADQFEICKIDLLRNMFECIQKRKLQN